MNIKITHLTSAHDRYDTRIFLKMCSSLSKNENYKVSLVVADGKGDETKNRVAIVDVGPKVGGRISRMTNTVKKVFQKAKELNSDIYHLHDPELIPIGLKLKKLGKKVVFDVHENISKQILNKEYINKYLRVVISKIYRAYENYALKKFDYLILAEDSYVTDYKKVANIYEIILNMPDIKPLEKFYSVIRTKNELFYIGGISNNRGLDVTIEAINLLHNKFPDIFMHYIGSFDSNISKDLKIMNHKNIKFYGSMPLFEGMALSKNAKIGLSILKPIANYKESYSTKIFEYMAIGLPVITSNFELYKEIVEKYKCGVCVNPLDPKEIAEAIEYIISHPKEAEQMGQNGKKVVVEKYNWDIEELKLFKVYDKLTESEKGI